MGNSESASANIEDEIAFLAEYTGLDPAEIRAIHQEQFHGMKKMKRKDFVELYKKAFPKAINAEDMAKRVFAVYDTDGNGSISFSEFVVALYMVVKAPKKEKLAHLFKILDTDRSGSLSSNEVIQAVKNAHNILGQLNFDYALKGIEIFRKMDKNKNLKVNEDEFVEACMQDDELCSLLEQSLGKEAMCNDSSAEICK